MSNQNKIGLIWLSSHFNNKALHFSQCYFPIIEVTACFIGLTVTKCENSFICMLNHSSFSA